MSAPPVNMAALGLCLLLAACGGNGSGGSNPPPVINVAAEGVWSGTTASGNSFDMLALDHGELYTLYGSSPTGVFQALGFIQGAYSLSGSTLSAPAVTQYHYTNAAVIRTTGSLYATVLPGISITGSTSNIDGTASTTFSATPSAATYSSYSYNTAASLGDIAGAWSGASMDQSATFVSINKDTGELAGSNLGCSFKGMLTPRPSGKNVFNANLTFDPTLCAAAGVSTSGIALSYGLPNGKRRLLLATQDTNQSVGFLFDAER
ncbi:MAG: hypothetical protein HXX19_03530 [Rhodoferax sp.]|nr:hypothetical protein [Rhodoferax sp.]